MWWLIRLGFIVGGTLLAGEVLTGCSRRREERPLLDHSSSSSSSGSPPTPPRLPSVGSATEPNAAPSGAPAAISSFIDCSRLRSPVFTVDVTNPQQELQIFRRVVPLLNRYTSQLSQNDFSGVNQDRELNDSLLTLQGVSVYLREGNSYALDRESDLINLYAGFDWLQRLETLVNDPGANDEISRTIRSGWRENRLTVNFKGFLLQDYRVPHRDGRGAQPPSQEGQSQPYNRFRIVNPLNLRDYPDFNVCGIPENVVYSWTVRPSPTP